MFITAPERAFFFPCSRTFLSIIGGVIAGILGLTGLTGFVFYFLMMTITSVALIAKAKFSIHTYFDSWNRVLLDGFLGGLMVCFSDICRYIFVLVLSDFSVHKIPLFHSVPFLYTLRSKIILLFFVYPHSYMR